MLMIQVFPQSRASDIDQKDVRDYRDPNTLSESVWFWGFLESKCVCDGE